MPELTFESKFDHYELRVTWSNKWLEDGQRPLQFRDFPAAYKKALEWGQQYGNSHVELREIRLVNLGLK